MESTLLNITDGSKKQEQSAMFRKTSRLFCAITGLEGKNNKTPWLMQSDYFKQNLGISVALADNAIIFLLPDFLPNAIARGLRNGCRNGGMIDFEILSRGFYAP